MRLSSSETSEKTAELSSAGKAVTAHLVFYAVVSVFVSLEPSADREEDGRAARPDRRICVPEIFGSVGTVYVLKLSTEGGDTDG